MRQPPGRPAHLARRFFSTLRSRRPGPDDQLFVAGLVSPAEARLFWAQAPSDQAHGVSSARAVLALRPGRDDLARAALLHDVGKRHARLGVIGRSLASGLALLRLPVRGRFARYLDHGALGADDLEAIGSDALTVAFARHHHGPPPEGADEGAWEALAAADEE